MAIILYHHRWPEHGYGSYNGTDFSSAVFNWDAMTPTYDETSSEASCNEVARLMSLCGVAVDMFYGVGASSASTAKVASALKRNFGYESVHYASRDSYGVRGWIDKIYNELSENRPVVYSGQPYSGSGHAFVCDGYDGAGYFHLNFGWGGHSDGYFMLHSIALGEVGTGGGTGNYSCSQGMVYGIERPDVGNHVPLMLYGRSLSWRSSKPQQFSCNVSAIDLPAEQNVEVEMGVQVVSVQTHEMQFIPLYKHTFKYAEDSQQTLTMDLSGVKTLGEGIYRVYPAFRGVGKTYSDQFMTEGRKYLMLQVAADGTCTLSYDSGDVSATFTGTVSMKHNLYRLQNAEFHVEVTAQGNELLGQLNLILRNSSGSTSWFARRPLAILPGETQTFDWEAQLTGSNLVAGEYTLVCSVNDQEFWEDDVYVHEKPTGTFQLASPIEIKNPVVVRDSLEVSYTVKSVGGVAVGYVYGASYVGDSEGVYLELQEGEERRLSHVIKFDKDTLYTRSTFWVYTYERGDTVTTNLTPEEFNHIPFNANPKHVFSITDETVFPDPVLRTYLAGIDQRGDGIVTEEELNLVQSLDFSNQGVSTLKGIEYFEKLRELNCSNNNLDSLDVSSFPELIYLYCNNNNLDSLDVSSLSKLNRLHCWNNKLQDLKLPESSALTDLSCGDNQLKQLSLASQTNLGWFSCTVNQIEALDFSACDSLVDISCRENQIKELDVSGLKYLESVDCCYNPLLEKLDLPSHEYLTSISCIETGLKKLEISHLPALRSLHCEKNPQLDTLVIEDLPKLSLLSVYEVPLEKLSVKNVPLLDRIGCSGADLNTVELEQLPNLKTLSLQGSLSDMERFDFSTLPALESLDFSGKFEVKSFSPESSSLRSIGLSDTSVLETLDVTGCPALESLSVNNTQLKEIVLSNENLSDLSLNNPGNVNYLNLAGCPALKKLYINPARLYMLDLSNNTALEQVTINPWGPNSVQVEMDKFYNFDLTPWIEKGFDVNRMSELYNCTLVGDHVLQTKGYGSARYQYATGNEKYPTFEVLVLEKVVDPNEGKTFRITYMVDDEVYATEEVVYGEKIELIAEPVKEGYTFSGWSEVPELMPANDLVVTGRFGIKTYSITYMVDGEVYATENLVYGAKIELMAEPVKDGYTFSGWSEVPETMPEHDVVVTGSFEIKAFDVIYMVDDEVYATDRVVCGEKIELRAEPTKRGHTFSGWSEVPELMPEHEVVVTGYFEAKIYRITYKVDDEVYFTEDVAYGELIEFIAEPVKDGYTFSGWTTSYKYMPARDVVVTGRFETVVGINAIPADVPVDVYRIDGLLLLQQVPKAELYERLSRGIYMVRTGRQIVKVVIR